MKTKYFYYFLFLCLSTSCFAGVYDGEIAAVQKYMGEYIEQNQKNILALGKLYSAYTRLDAPMQDVIRSKKLLRGRCLQEDIENFKNCLADQSVAIFFLDFYTRHTEQMVKESKAEALEAGQILHNQDVSNHIARFDKIAHEFKVWREESIPTLKEIFTKERDQYIKLSGLNFDKDSRVKFFENEDKHVAITLNQELLHTALRMVVRGEAFLAEHRLGRAKFTLGSMFWLQRKIPLIWKSISIEASQDPNVIESKKNASKEIKETIDRFSKELSERDPKKELEMEISYFRSEIKSKKLSNRNKQAFANLLAGLNQIEKSAAINKIGLKEVLLERGFIWLEAASK